VSVIDTLKFIAGLVQKIGDIELNSKIIDLQQEVFSLLDENYRLKQEIEKLKHEIDELKKINEIESNLIMKGHFYYIKKGDSLDGMFCTACWDDRRKLIRVHKADYIASCPVCKNGSSYFE